MGHTRRKNEIRENMMQMEQAWETEREALAAVRRFNAQVSARGSAWFWPKIATAITGKHPWLVIARDSCGAMVDLDLRVVNVRRLP